MATAPRSAALLLTLCLVLFAGGTESLQLVAGGSHAKSLARKLLGASSRFLQVLEEVIEPRLSAVMGETSQIESGAGEFSIEDLSREDSSREDSSAEDSSSEDSSAEDSSSEDSSAEESSAVESSGGVAQFWEGSSTYVAALTRRAVQEVDEESITIVTVPIAEDSSAGDSSAEDSSAEDSSAEDSSAGDSSAEDSSAEDSSAEDSSAEDSSAEASSGEVIVASQLIEAVY